MAEQFPRLSAATLAAANQVGAWLAQDDLAMLPALPQVDVVVLAGNAVIPTIDAACRLAAEREVPLLISGGVGHSTNYLYEAVRQDTRYRMLPVVGRPEAHILADIAHDYWQIPRSRLVVEDQSTNCGENARFTRTTLENGGILHRRGIVIQDPTMGHLRPRLAGSDDAATVAELSRLLAGAGADRWSTGVRGRRGGAVAGRPLPGAAAGRAAAPAGYA